MTSRPARAPRANPHSFYTQPVRALRVPPQQRPAPRQIRPAGVAPVAVAPRPAPTRDRRRTQRPTRRSSRYNRWWAVVAATAVGTMALAACLIVTLGAILLYGSGKTLPGVHSAGVELGSLSRADAAAALESGWSSRGVLLRDGDRVFPVDPAILGITLDVDSTVRAAYQYGRAAGGLPAALRALTRPVNVAPVVAVDEPALIRGLQELAAQVSQPAVNAGVRLVNGRVEERPARPGRALDVEMTVARLQSDPARELADGDIELVSQDVQPAVTDASALVAAASSLLSSPLHLRAWDPVDDTTADWAIPPETWGHWLTAQPDETAPLGLRLALDGDALRNYLAARSSELGPGAYLAPDEAAETINAAIADGRADALLRVYHHERQHTVQPGETIISIAWDYGVPYPYVLQANPHAGDALSAGQTLTIPSPDEFMDYEPVYGKRIVVSISQQRVWVYENGNLKWEWIASTGIPSSPTWPGIYQVISHEPNAYAGNWDLWMPNFIGVYRPIPGADFTNGFHGFPTRGGSQLLWTNSLGTRVTYGCILLSDENVQQLYAWAEEGVIVEIQP